MIDIRQNFLGSNYNQDKNDNFSTEYGQQETQVAEAQQQYNIESIRQQAQQRPLTANNKSKRNPINGTTRTLSTRIGSSSYGRSFVGR